MCVFIRLYTYTVRKPCHAGCILLLFVSLKDWKHSLGGMPKESDCGASGVLTKCHVL